MLGGECKLVKGIANKAVYFTLKFIIRYSLDT